MAKMVPKEALDYIKKKGLKPAFSYQDVWNEEHATAFTVAKAMQIDVLADIKTAVEQAIANGQTFESFKKNLGPTLQAKGWWGRKDMVDPKTGEVVSAQLGSDRRLRTIYNVNTRQAYLKGAWDRGMASTAHPYIMYCLGPSAHHRTDHQAWAGVTLAKDDPFWNTHAPMNGWGCKCYLRFLSEDTYQEYKANGVPQPKTLDGSGGQPIPMKTDRPPIKMQSYMDKKTGKTIEVPEGISPGFDWNPGAFSRSAQLTSNFYDKTKGLAQRDRVMTNFFQAPQVRQDYLGFVGRALKGATGKGEINVIGYLSDDLIKAVEAHGKTPAAGLVAIEEKLLRSKNTLHGAAGLTEEEWKALPDFFRAWDALVWNVSWKKPVFLKTLSETATLVMAFDFGVGIQRGVSLIDVDALRSVYKKAQSIDTLLKQTERDGTPSYVLIKKKSQ